MLSTKRKAIFLFLLFAFCGLLLASMFSPEPVVGANVPRSDALSLESKLTDDDKLKPVDNMHHFMEYIYEPVFNNLKTSVAKEPADKAGWTAIKSGALILAETSILLAKRTPPENKSSTWKESSELVYQGGSSLYQAARKKDFGGVQKHFGEMINGCKKCHEQYRKKK